MPEALSIHDFIAETLEDTKCHNASLFFSKISAYKTTVADLDEASENDRATLSKIRKAVKNIYKSGISHADNEVSLCDQLERLGKDGVDAEENDEDNEIGTGMYKFGVILRDLSQKFRQLMQNLNNTVMFPLDTFLKAELRNDLRKSFDKAIKDYESKYEKLKKEKLQAAKESGVIKSDTIPAEVAEELEKERRILQLQMCEYLIKVNEIKAKKGAELLQHLIDYYHAQTNYLEDSMETLKHFGMCMQDLVTKVNTIKSRHDEQKRKLVTTREELKKLIETELTNRGNTIQPSPAPVGYSLHQPQGNKAHGTRKTGFLLKKSDGKVKRLWQRRRVRVADGGLMLYHADESKAPVTLPLLTCHVKMVFDTDLHGKYCFDLISNNRTYHFQVDDSKEREEWISVLNNAKQEVFERAMSDDSGLPSNSCESILGSSGHPGLNSAGGHTSMEQSSYMDQSAHPSAYYLSPSGGGAEMMQSMTASGYTSRWERRRIIEEIAKLPGNDVCADCDARDPEWCSVNLGVLICLECCGVHRELGVHFSRTQSLKMDDLSLNQLLLPRFIGNQTFNEVYESTLADGIKPKCQDPNKSGELDDLMTQRKNFIRAKYVEHRYVCCTSDGTEEEMKYLRKDLLLGVRNAKLSYLLQVHGEHIDLLAPLNPDDDEEAGSQADTALHVALTMGHRDMSIHGSRSSNADSQEDLEDDSEDLDLMADSNNLAIIEFLVQNSPSASVQRTNNKKENVLHQCVRYNRPEALKLILKAVGVPNQMLQAVNQDDLTPLQMSQNLKVETCSTILSQMELISNNNNTGTNQMDKREKESILEILDTLNIDWGLSIPNNPPGRLLHPPMVDSGNESPGEHRDSSTKQSTQGSLSDDLDSVDHPVVTTPTIPMKKPPRLTSCVSFSEGSSTPTSVARISKPTKTATLSSASMSAYDHVLGEKQKMIGSLSPGLNVATLPRKRSSKGPAPAPPGIISGSPLHQSTPTSGPTATATLGRKRHSIPDNQNSNPPRPNIPPKPQISLTKSHSLASSDRSSVTPRGEEESPTQPTDTTKTPNSQKDSATLASRIFLRDSKTPPSSYDRNCQTLPRGMGRMYASYTQQSNYSQESSTDDSSIFTSPLSHLHRSKDDMSKPEQNPQGSDHIDVILDVLEGPLPSIFDDTPLMPESFLTNHSIIEESDDSESSGTVATTKSSTTSDISAISKSSRKVHNEKKPSILASLSNDVEPIQEEECEITAAGEGGGGSTDGRQSSCTLNSTPRRRVRALYNCDAERSDEVSFKKGEIIVLIMSNPKEDWWEGYLESCPNRRGLFPMTYVQKISE